MKRELGVVKAADSADWLLSRGIASATTSDLAQMLGVDEDQVRRRLHSRVSRGEWVMPVRGLWIPIPPEYRTWGAPEGIEIIDVMMRHLGASYYVGWLSAAQVHGASHHAPQVFQVAVDKQVRNRIVGRTRFEFAQRDVDTIPVELRPTSSGSVRVSTAAVTCLDLASDVARGGGIDNIATVLIELSDEGHLDVSELSALSTRFPAAAGRRVGYVLDRYTGRTDLEELRAVVRNATLTPSRLDPARDAAGAIDWNWQVYVNRELEPDS